MHVHPTNSGCPPTPALRTGVAIPSWLAVLLLTLCGLRGEAADLANVSFTREIAPILLQKCVICHGPEKSKGNYRLHTFADALKAGSSKDLPIAPGAPEKSQLYQLLLAKDPDDRMPQKDDPLPVAQIALIQRWIHEGAKFDGPDSKATLASFVTQIQPDPPAAYPRPVPVTALAFSPDGKQLAAAGYHEITLWNPADGALLKRIKNVAEQTHCLEFSKEGSLLAEAGGTPGRMGEVKLFDPATGALVKTLATLPDLALALCFSPDGRRLACGGADNAIRVFDVASGRQELLIEQHADWVLGLAFSPDGTQLASASRDKSARLFDAKTGELQYSYLVHGEPVFSVAYAQDGKTIFSAGRDKKIHSWDSSSNAEGGSSKRKGGSRARDISGFEGDVLKILVSSNLLASCSADKSVRLYSADTHELTREFAGHHDVVYGLAMHPGSHRLASGDYDGEIRIWNLDDGKPVTTFVAAPGFPLKTAQTSKP